jgi:CheY-like chemotaxis protein
MLSSSLLLGDAGKARKFGLNAFLTKPLGPSDVRDAVLAVLGEARSEGRRPLRTSSEDTAPRPTRILLAEDNPVNQLVATKLLERQGYQVTVAANGAEVLKLHSHQPRPYDLILMDIQMPEMDGLETTQAIRHRELTSGEHLPIIALTAHAMNGDRERCLAIGMDGYVSKPIRLDELEAELKLVRMQVGVG